MAAAPRDIDTIADLESWLVFALTDPSELHVTFLYADFDEASRPGGAMDGVVKTLGTLHPAMHWCKVDAEGSAELSDEFEISVVPTFVFMKNRRILDKLEGADPAELAKRVERYAASPVAGQQQPPPGDVSPPALASLIRRMDGLVKSAPVVLFMKGSPAAPKCKFSKTMVELLAQSSVTYNSFDILTMPAVRQGIKVQSNWPTYPQLYINGELIGGVDIVKELVASGEFASYLPAATAGQVATGKGGEMQASVVATVMPAGASVDSSASPPRAARAESSSTSSTGPSSLSPELRARLLSLIGSAPLMLFMKGDPEAPQCGFSSKICKLLDAEKLPYSTFDILSAQDVRDGLKVHSDWPTFPQLYANGALIGGLDIVSTMAEDAKSGGPSLAEQLGVAQAAA